MSLAKYLKLTPRKNSHRFEEYVNKACQANFDKINIENCHGSGCRVLQNKKLVEKIKFFRQQINEKNFIIRSLFPLKLPHRVKKIIFLTYVEKKINSKNQSESCIVNEIPVCKFVSGSIKVILLYIQK